MTNTAVPSATSTPSQALKTFLHELEQTIQTLGDSDAKGLQEVAQKVRNARRIFVVAAGRSGLALRMTAMRLMHLGLDVHIAGDVTTPAITEGDLLIAASGSGTTGSIVRAAETAARVGAEVIAFSTTDQSPLSAIASKTIVIPAASKQNHDSKASKQYSGSLFEQALVLVGDSIFHSLWKGLGESADSLWMRHANLE